MKYVISKIGKRLFFAAVLLFFAVAIARASQDSRRIEEENRASLEQTELEIVKAERRVAFDCGGWLNFRYIDYKDDDNDSSSRDSYDYDYYADMRIWLKATVRQCADLLDENRHTFYLRLEDLREVRRPTDTAGGSDHNGPHVDYAYAVLDFRPLWIQAGRRYFSVGQEIAYSNVNDGVELLFFVDDLELKAFVSQTLPHEDNIDTSVPGYLKGSSRNYYAIECAYSGFFEQNVYAYFLAQRDHSDEEPEDPVNDFTYDSEYIGMGAKGDIYSALHYRAEIIKETGSSLVYGTNEKRDVDAWGGLFGLDYEPEIYSHPTISFQYAFGTGDPDRINVTDTQDGNLVGDDTNFLYFGYLPTGYALSPVLSNLHLYNAGVTFKPLEKFYMFRNFELGVNYYRYYKDRPAGGIYDIDATEWDSDVGSEIDLNLTWQILSDVGCELQYGHFEPQDAYPASTNDSEEYLSISAIVTF